VLIFFIAGLLYLLRFERVDNLGAYSIPSETGLLIPSVYINQGRSKTLETLDTTKPSSLACRSEIRFPSTALLHQD
jgi:hypothetical protein